jgi:hypothetical protein
MNQLTTEAPSVRRLAGRYVLAPTLMLLLMTSGLAALTKGKVKAAASSTSSSCFPSMDNNVGNLGDFTDSSAGGGTGDVGIETPNASFEGTGRVSWSLRQTVTGTSGLTPSMSGAMNLSVSQGSHSVSFVSSCILEAGVFAGETEEDPNDGSDQQAIRGIEGEWIGTAYNFPAPGQQTKVVASLAVWTTANGPKFHLDVSTGIFTSGVCPDESDTNGSISAGGPTGTNNIVVNAPNQQAGWGSCAD